MSNLKANVILTLSLVAIAVLCFMVVREQGASAEREKQFKADVEAYKKHIDKATRIAADLEAQLTAMRLNHDNLRKELEDETLRNPVYVSADCNVPADGLRIYNDTRAQGSAAR